MNSAAYQRPIMIGDYANIIIGKIENNTEKTYDYHITKIEPNFITIAEIEDSKKLRYLSQNAAGIWQIAKYKLPHTVTFSKNATDLKYFDRDFTQAPNKIIIIVDNPRFREVFTELPNGIILHEAKGSSISTILKFSDPSNLKELTIAPSNYVNFKSAKHRKQFPTDYSKPFLEITNSAGMAHAIFNLDGEIFIYDSTFTSSKYIAKLNLDNHIFTIYDRNPGYIYIFPLRDKKLLCLLNDNSMYILDLTKQTDNRKTISMSGQLIFDEDPAVHQLSNNNIILQIYVENTTTDRSNTEFYHIDIENGVLTRIATYDIIFNIIAILKNDKFLVITRNIIKQTINIVILDIQTNQGDIIFDIPKDNLFYDTVGILLKNGDVLFHIKTSFYLFTYENQTVSELEFSAKESSLPENFDVDFKQLKNGNIIINNYKYLAILDFPLNQRSLDQNNYDEITPSISIIPLDMVALIRNYI